ncbi:MAG: alpha/beta hydrolase [Bacteroidota bacterium]
MISYPYKTHYLALPGNCNIAYADEGAGPGTLLFIHGLANYLPVWRKNIDELRKHYRCIAIDLPGSGLSDQKEHPYGVAFFADTVYQFISAMRLTNVCIVGHSMGGQIAMATVLRYPLCAARMVLCAPAGFERFTALDKTLYYSTLRMFDFMSSDEHSLRSTIENSFYRNSSQGEPMVRELIALMKTYKTSYYRKMIEACIKGMLEEPVYDALHTIQQPTLVIFGRQDALIPNKLLHHTTTEKLAAEAVKKMPHAALLVLPDCGHFVQWEKAAEVNQYIHAFMQQ